MLLILLVNTIDEEFEDVFSFHCKGALFSVLLFVGFFDFYLFDGPIAIVRSLDVASYREQVIDPVVGEVIDIECFLILCRRLTPSRVSSVGSCSWAAMRNKEAEARPPRLFVTRSCGLPENRHDVRAAIVQEPPG